MMKICVVDPIISRKKICAFSIFDDCAFLYQHILKISQPEIGLYFNKEEYKHICFDTFKTLDMFGFRIDFLYDVKVLYELAGKRFDNLIELGRAVLGNTRLEKYVEISSTINAHLNSYKVAKIKISKYGQEDLFPPGIFQDLYKERSTVIADLFGRFEDKDIVEYYEKTMYKNVKGLYTIAKEPVHIDLEKIKDSTVYFAKTIRKNTENGTTRLKFNAVGAKTGRLSFKKGSLNIYNMPKSLRKCIVAPENYKIVQFDFKSFQPRLAIFSTDDEDFKKKFVGVEDIYSLFAGEREETKISFLSWIFSNSKNEEFEKEAWPIQNLKSKVYSESKKNGKVRNRFDRVLCFGDEEKHVVFQNYITSLEVDVILNLVRWINSALKSRKSRILFPFHDAIVFLIHKDELDLIEPLRNYLESAHKTVFGTTFPVDIKVGSNFGELND
jgi:hypothetical protein